MLTSPLSWLFLKPQFCSAKANAQRIQQETFPVLPLPLRQLLLLDFKGWVGRGWTTAAHNGWATAPHLPTKLSPVLLHLENKRKTPKSNLASPAAFPLQAFPRGRGRSRPFPSSGDAAGAWGKGAELRPAAADSPRSYLPVTAQQHEAD